MKSHDVALLHDVAGSTSQLVAFGRRLVGTERDGAQAADATSAAPVAAAILFLARPDASYVTGTTLDVDESA